MKGSSWCRLTHRARWPATCRAQKCSWAFGQETAPFDVCCRQLGWRHQSGTALIDSGSVANPALWNTAVQRTWRVPHRVLHGRRGTWSTRSETDMLPMRRCWRHRRHMRRVRQFRCRRRQRLLRISGARVVISGTPAAGDRFSVTPSSDQSIFKTIQNLIGCNRDPGHGHLYV